MGITASLFRSTGQTTDNEFNLENARDESIEAVSAEAWLWNASFPLTATDLSGTSRAASDATSNWNPESYVSWQLASGPWSIVREPGACLSVVRNGPQRARGARRGKGALRRSEHPSTGTAVGTVLDNVLQPGWLYDVVSMDLWNPHLIDLLQLRIQRSFKSSLNEALSVEEGANEALTDSSATHEEALLALLLHLLWLPNSGSSTRERVSSEWIRYSMNTPWSQACPSLTRQDIWALCAACLQASLYAPCAHVRQRDSTDKRHLLNDREQEATPGTPDSNSAFESHVVSGQPEWNGAQSRCGAGSNKTSKQFGKQMLVQEDRKVNTASSCVLCYCLRKRFLLRLRRDMAVTRWLLMMFAAEHGGLSHRLPAWVANVPLCIGCDSLKHIEQILSCMLGAVLDMKSFSHPSDDLAVSPWTHSIRDIERASIERHKIRGHNPEIQVAWNASMERVRKGSKAPLEEIERNSNDEEVLFDGICPRLARSSGSSAWDRFRQSCAQVRLHVSYDPLQHDLFADGCLSLPFEKLFDVAALFQSLSVLTRRSRTPAVLNDPIGGEMNPAEGCSLRAHSERQRQIQETQQLASESNQQASASKSSESKYSFAVVSGPRSHGERRVYRPCSCRGSLTETFSLRHEAPSLLDRDLIPHHEHDRTREPLHSSSATRTPLPIHEPISSFQEGFCAEGSKESRPGPRPHSSPICMHKRHRQDTLEEQRKSLSSSEQGRRRTRSLQSVSGGRCRFASSLDDHRDAFIAGAWNAERDHPLRGDLERLERYVHALEQVTEDLERLMDSFKTPPANAHQCERHRKSASSPSLSTPSIPSCSRRRPDLVLVEDPKTADVFDLFEMESRTRQPLMHCFHGLVREGILSESLYPSVCALSTDDHTAWSASNGTTCNESLSAVNVSQGSTSDMFENSAAGDHSTRMQNSRAFLMTPFWLACTASAAFKSYWGSAASASSPSNEQPRLLNQDSFHRGSSLTEQLRHSSARFWTRRSDTTARRGMATSHPLTDSSSSAEAIFVSARSYRIGTFPSTGSCRGYTIVYRCRETADASMPYPNAVDSTSPTQVSAKASAISPLSVVSDASPATLAAMRRDAFRSMDRIFQGDSATRVSEAPPNGPYPWGSLSSASTLSPADVSGALSERYRSPEGQRERLNVISGRH
ncbi:F-box and leucine-rich repeat protein 14 [Cyanidiococcus yangmingshanensis]|uniref:F-box and leucine-rich repeat protein 14 n=1 Tax=Cyanidiococcus yangmingshanensis TaxID=2690220 RepID=A0A7J7IK66_9RHOD|nr:F-box and leucine-rich repeat protein 14 [Cyanidiococcus yangmingshanensis]